MENLRNRTYNLLRRSEKYTKTDMVYLTKGGFWLTLGQIVTSLSSLVLVIAFANLLSPELYGNYRYVISLIGVFAIATFPGINSVAITAVSRKEYSVFWDLFVKKITWSALSFLICLAGSIYYLLSDNLTLGISLLIASIWIPLQHTSAMYASFLNGNEDFKRLTISRAIVRIFTTILMVLAVLLTKNIFIFILIYFVPETLFQFSFIWKIKSENRELDTSTTSTDKFYKYGFHLSVMEVLKTIASHIDKILVFHYLGATQLAAYFIAVTAPSQIKGFVQNITPLAMPKFSKSDGLEAARSLPKKILLLEMCILIAIGAYWILAPIFFPLIFPEYIEVIFASQIYSLTLIFFPRTLLSTAMTAQMKQKEMYAIRISAPTIRILIFLVALPMWGFWGAIIGGIIGNALTAGIYHIYFRKAFPNLKMNSMASPSSR